MKNHTDTQDFGFPHDGSSESRYAALTVRPLGQHRFITAL